MSDEVIQTDRLTKFYGSSRGIEGLSLEVMAGEVFGFLGPNGAGKTTTIRTLLGMLRPTGGEARVLGHDIRREGAAIRARTGNLPGDFSFDERVTGEELLDLFEDLRGVGDRGFARSLAERFQADLDRPLGELSRGNRQKIGIIQAVAHRPELVIMDEPTSGLDPLMQEEFDELVGELRDGGATILLSSHNLSEVERMCERVAIIREGRLVTVETVEEIVGRAFRHVSLEFADPVDPGEFGALPGVEDVAVDGNRLSFRMSGEFGPMLSAAARHRVRDMEVVRPSLEEAFLTYYGGRG